MGTRYYKATGELAEKLFDWAARAAQVRKSAIKFAKRFGDNLGVCESSFGVYFSVEKQESPGPEWKLLNKKQPGFWAPKATGKVAKALHQELRALELSHPSFKEINDLIGFTSKHQFVDFRVLGVGVEFRQSKGFALLSISDRSKYSIPKKLAASGHLVRISDLEYEAAAGGAS